VSEISIPPIPSVIQKVIQFDPNNPDVSSIDLESIIRPDTGICTQLMKTSNSSFYGRSGMIKTLRDAINLLGLKKSKNLILLMSIKDLTITLKGKLFLKYMHELPVLTSLIAFDLCRPTKNSQLQEEAFLCGLLLKIGMAVIGNNKFRHYEQLLKFIEKSDTDLMELERDSYGIDQIEIGKQIIEMWNFPAIYRDAIARQDLEHSNVSQVDDLTRITVLGSIIAKNFLDIKTTVKDKEIAYLIFDHYNMIDDMQYFYGDEYRELLKEHPFYQLATSL